MGAGCSPMLRGKGEESRGLSGACTAVLDQPQLAEAAGDGAAGEGKAAV